MPERSLQDVRLASSGTIRGTTLLCLLIAAGFAVTLVLVRFWQHEKTPAAQVAPRDLLHVNAGVPVSAAVTIPARRISVQLNPAEQKPGPPDPESLRTAAVAAENAADAAAALAASVNGAGN